MEYVQGLRARLYTGKGEEKEVYNSLDWGWVSREFFWAINFLSYVAGSS
jgi:hypothetical protein